MSKLNELNRGVVLLVILAALTVVEFFIALQQMTIFLLGFIIVVKAGLVIWYFMHLPRVLSPEGEHES